MAEAGLDGHSGHLAGDRAGHDRTACPRAGPRRRSRRGGRQRGRRRGPGRERAAPIARSACVVEIDVGQGRTGVTRPEDAVRLARRIDGLPQLRYRGVQAYYGHLQHVPAYADRKAKAAEQWARLRPFLEALSAAGLRPEIVTGGGTGTCISSISRRGRSPRSSRARTCSWTSSTARSSWRPAAPRLSGLRSRSRTRVISANQPDLVVLDAGFKAMATDAGPALVAGGAAADAAYQFMGDEHGGLRFGRGRRAAVASATSSPWSRRIAIRRSTCTTGFTSCKTGVWSISGRSTRAAIRRLTMKTIVLGGGVIGTTTAYYLAKLGHEVHLVDRQDGVAMETSFANGGVLHTSEAEPWSRPGMPGNIWRWLGKEDAPMLLRYSALPGMWRWGLAFIRNCSLERYRRSTMINLRLSFYTLKCIKEIREETGIDYDLMQKGTLKIYTRTEALEQNRTECETMRPHGMVFEVVDASALRGDRAGARADRAYARRRPVLSARRARRLPQVHDRPAPALRAEAGRPLPLRHRGQGAAQERRSDRCGRDQQGADERRSLCRGDGQLHAPASAAARHPRSTSIRPRASR